MYPHERSLVKKLANAPFALIGVNSDRDLPKLRKAMEKEKITWRSFYDGGGTGGPIATRWRVSGWPTLYVIDAEGRIRFADIRAGELDQALMTFFPDLLGEESEGEEKGDAGRDL
jgi:hypothetical protein